MANKREIASDDCFDGLFATALDDDDIITSVRVNAPKRTAYVKFRWPASLFALVGVCVADGACGTRVVVTGAGEGGVFNMPS
ncbi:hypothetical protein [Aliiroseovarius sp. M344]|uniref:hypothetical protein n=1 Tax=Aliiroseovarius sp. M344 TaxID=2867010 RepID=UPI0021AE1F98|nr:hypothetical protein [Aliiroseovarius sp. M344]